MFDALWIAGRRFIVVVNYHMGGNYANAQT